ncbi:hypothetical protein ACNOYE_01215 [Nannocystaceae bacterium ST9]
MKVSEAPIERPCDEDWDRMHLDPSGLERFCDRCSKTVHDLSALGPERARALLAGAREPICIAYVGDRRGRIVFESRPESGFVPLARLAQAASLVASLSGCTSHADVEPLEIEDSAPMIEASSVPPPVVIPSQPPPPPEQPCEPEVDEPAVKPEPKPIREPLVKGRYKTAGVYYNPPSPDPLDR